MYQILAILHIQHTLEINYKIVIIRAHCRWLQRNWFAWIRMLLDDKLWQFIQLHVVPTMYSETKLVGLIQFYLFDGFSFILQISIGVMMNGTVWWVLFSIFGFSFFTASISFSTQTGVISTSVHATTCSNPLKVSLAWPSRVGERRAMHLMFYT